MASLGGHPSVALRGKPRLYQQGYGTDVTLGFPIEYSPRCVQVVILLPIGMRSGFADRYLYMGEHPTPLMVFLQRTTSRST